MLLREDMFVLSEGICNVDDKEHVLSLDKEFTLAGIQDVIGGLIEAAPEASSFVFTITRVSHTTEETVQ